MIDNTQLKAHPADKLCRLMLKRYPDAAMQADGFLSRYSVFDTNWPSYCALPMAAVYSIITNGMPPEKAVWRMRSSVGINDLAPLTAALIWSKTKMIYRFDATLSEALDEQPLDGDLPIEAMLHPPYPCVYIETGTNTEHGFFAWMECDPNTKMPELRILTLMRDGSRKSQPIPLSGGTIADSIRVLNKSATENAEKNSQFVSAKDAELLKTADKYADMLAAHLSPKINRLLYLCSEEPDVVPSDQGERVVRHFDRHRRPVEPVMWDVGIRLGAALRRGYEAEREIVHIDGGRRTHASPRAHMRRAHWHHFWSGPKNGPRNITLKWLPPIPVNITQPGDFPATITPVK